MHAKQKEINSTRFNFFLFFHSRHTRRSLEKIPYTRSCSLNCFYISLEWASLYVVDDASSLATQISFRR